MKRLTAAAVAVMLCAALTACSFGDSSNLWVPNVFTDPVSGAEESVPDDSAGDPVSPEDYDDVPLPYAVEYFISGESKNVQTACKALVKGIRSRKTKISLEGLGIDRQKLGDLVSMVISSAPELPMIMTDYKYIADSDGDLKSCTISYMYGDSEQKEIDTELSTAADVIVGATDGMDDFSKLKSFHDAIVKKCSYIENAESPYSAYGCLCEGEAVCEGYSKAFMLLCERAGIKCIPVIGYTTDSGKEPHMWNKVLSDGKWYNFDITWDDPVSDIKEDFIKYDYFGLTDAEFDLDHSAEESSIMKYPEASSDEMDYYKRTGAYISDASKADGVILTELNRRMFAGERFIQIKCSDKATFDAVMKREFESSGGNAHIFSLFNSSSFTGSFVPNSYSVMKNEKLCTVLVLFE